MLSDSRNVGLAVSRKRNAFAGDDADGHFVGDGEGAGDNVAAVEAVADNARTNCVAVETDNQVEERGAVADFYVARTVEINGGERFFGKVERVEVALLVSQVGIGFQVVEGDLLVGGKRVAGRHKHVQRRGEYGQQSAVG